MTTTSTSTDLAKLGYLFAEIMSAGALGSPTRLLTVDDAREPIVEHTAARERALAAYARIRGS
jgi:hypothetical protein